MSLFRSCARVTVYFSMLISICLSKEENLSTKTLKQVHMLFRHGDRAPISPYPLDPNNSEELWPNGYGQLTKRGMQQHQRLGRWFREEYGGLLSETWNYTQLSVTSTSVDRTLNSVAANLQGLYSAVPKDKRFDLELDWNPVPIRSSPAGEDKLLNVDDYCPRIAEETKALYHSEAVQKVVKKCKAMFELLTKKLGKTVDTIQDMDYVYDYFYIQSLYNMSTPDWLLPHMPFLNEVSQFSFEILAYTEELKRLRGGPLVSKIISDMESKVASEGNSSARNPSVFMYSAHDTTVAANLQTVGVYNHVNPPYAACVIYELHQTQDDYFVKVLYRNDTVQEGGSAMPLTVPGCDTACPLRQFHALLHKRLPTEYAAECGRDAGHPGDSLGAQTMLAAVKEAFSVNEIDQNRQTNELALECV